ncbi:putative fatty-acid amide hydrolase [Xylariomycetidae sp. FL2044]|nr:putative fatty-acid amide hydrolase [Xylariomycetidae sp. FL2044]
MENYKILAAEKQAQRWARIPQEWRISLEKFESANNVMDVPISCGLLDETEIRITSDYDATALLEQLRSRVWTVEQVTVAFCKRAAIAQQLTNCLTEIFFDTAIARAKKLDSQFQWHMSSDNGSLPPLFGLPISLKDSFQVAGHDTSTGLGCYVDEAAEKNSNLAAMLLDLGAVLYCKTNLPQSIMTADSDNNIFGRTLNPRNKTLTAGGSTGGEGALLALRGSILGVGTDIAGSIRVPSSCNGVYGFRPSVGLVPHGGVRDVATPGISGILSTAGPMATSLRDCALFLKTILRAEPWKYDSASVSVPWVDLKPKHSLRVGVAQNDGVFTASPPIRRGLKEATDRLRTNANVEVIPIDLPHIGLIYEDVMSYLSLSGGDYYLDQFARTGEPVIPSLQRIGIHLAPGTTLQGYLDLNIRRAKMAEKYLELFREHDIDVILMPPAPHTALPLDHWSKPAYTCPWNYLDYPAVVIPVDQVRDTDVADNFSNATFGPPDEELYGLYTGPEQYKDAPVCVQVVGYRHRDEVLLKVASSLDSIINRV